MFSQTSLSERKFEGRIGTYKFKTRLTQGCQMVHIISNQNFNLGKFWRDLSQFGIFCGNLEYLSRFDTLY
jgi:hypothetical protein